MMQLKGQVAIVTGAGTGIGRGIALALAGEGARPVLCGRRMNRLQETLAAIQEAGGEGLAVQADVSQQADVERVVAKAVESFGAAGHPPQNTPEGGGGEE